MKKILLTVALTMAASLAATAANAAGATGTPTAFTGNKTVTNADDDCPLLANSTVVLGASASVNAAYSCNAQTNIIKVGACHEGGSRTAKDGCAITNPDAMAADSTVAAEYNYNSCTSDMIGKVPTDVPPDFKAYGIGSSGGTIAAYQLGGKCTTTSIVSGTDIASKFWK